MIIVEHNVETNEVIERTMTAAEEKEFVELQNFFVIEQAAKEAARQAILDKIGLTADEVTALLA